MSSAQNLLEGTAAPPTRQRGSSLVEPAAPDLWHLLARFSPHSAEFVGSAFLAMMWNSSALDAVGVWRPMIMGLTLMVMTYSFATISGAEFNPAVTLATCFAGKGTWAHFFFRGTTQFLGCFAGIGASILLYGKRAPYHLAPGPSYTDAQVFGVEMVYTFMLCFVYLNCLVSRGGNPVKSGNQFFGVAMGFALLAGTYAAGAVSGAVFNPAIAAAIYFENPASTFWLFIMFCTAHSIAAFLAASLFRISRPDEELSHQEWWVAETEEREIGPTKQKAFCEAVGTWLFVFTIGITHLSPTMRSARPLAGGAVYVCLHYAVADCSGGYFNPAVTLAVMMGCPRRCSLLQGLSYITVQILAGSVAVMSYQRIASFPAIMEHANLVYGSFRILAAELIFMNLISLVVLSTVTIKGVKTDAPQNFYHGLAYGLAYAAGGFATYGLTCGVLNPAVAIGIGVANRLRPNVTFSDSAMTVLWKCLSMAAFELGGSGLAVVIFRLVNPNASELTDNVRVRFGVRQLAEEDDAEADLPVKWAAAEEVTDYTGLLSCSVSTIRGA